ncbi:MAG: DNA polymerase III subunit delta' [Gammaproteobacteria bacterium]|nr:DNA polymerase III subunit delta' [Gammaproteobacteria bacterium]
MYNWQTEQRDYLNNMLRANKFPHALLFSGPDGTGKKQFAAEYAKKLLCSSEQDEACGHCHSCQVFAADTHPDYLHVAPLDEGKAIAVDVIRELIVKLSKTSQFGGKTVAIIDNAEQLNRNSANALLKTLEEPTPDTILVLVCSYPHRLLPTIRSRCLQIAFPVPEKSAALGYLQQQNIDDAELYLQLSHGSPLTACQVAGSELAEQRKSVLKILIKTSRGQAISPALKEIEKIPLKATLDWSIDFCDDLIRVKSQGDQADITHIDVRDVLSKMAACCQIQALYGVRDLLIERKKQSNIALNTQLLLEDLLILWKQAFKTA